MKIAVLGGTGRTGRLVVDAALADGHEVVALAREPARLPVAHPQLTIITGDAASGADVARLLSGCDAAISALGPTGRNAPPICAQASGHVIAAGIPRYIVVSGAGITLPEDRKTLPGKLISLIVRTVAPAMFADKVREAQILAASGLRYTLVRPPRLVDGPATGKVRAALDDAPGTKITRADLARFVLDQLKEDAHVRRAPFVAN